MSKTASSAFTLATQANVPMRVVATNENRVAVSMKNVSDTNMYYGFDKAVTTSGRTMGWEITANGGSVREEDAKDEIYVVCASSGKLLHVVDVIKVE